jgi:N-acetylneuraminate synthase
MKEVFIIAEIGINHNGDMELVKKLIDMAKDTGCDAVKFQKRTIDVVYTKDLLESARDSPWGKTQRAQKEGLELKEKDYDAVDSHCKEKGIEWFASAWDIPSQKMLRRYKSKYNKVASAMLTSIPFLKAVAEEKKHTYISTGMSSLEEIDKAVAVFREQKCPFTLLHCVSTYPCEDADCNLLCMETLKKRYNCEVGYSGHERGILPSVLAVALGAIAIERHITLDKKMYGSDQAASVENADLELMIKQIREIPRILGNGSKCVSEKERSIAKKLRYFESQ